MYALKVPCQDCKERVQGCHSSCPKYIEFKKSKIEPTEDEISKKAIDNDRYKKIGKAMWKKHRGKRRTHIYEE